jgi:hypothetical protein
VRRGRKNTGLAEINGSIFYLRDKKANMRME